MKEWSDVNEWMHEWMNVGGWNLWVPRDIKKFMESIFFQKDDYIVKNK